MEIHLIYFLPLLYSQSDHLWNAQIYHKSGSQITFFSLALIQDGKCDYVLSQKKPPVFRHSWVKLNIWNGKGEMSMRASANEASMLRMLWFWREILMNMTSLFMMVKSMASQNCRILRNHFMNQYAEAWREKAHWEMCSWIWLNPPI